MSLFSILGSAQSGMNAATKWLEASASNVANMRTTGAVPTAGGKSTVYQPVTVRQTDNGAGGVDARIVPRNPAWHLEPDPGSPDADARGMVAAPDVDVAGEVATQLTAKLQYAASAKIMKTASEMMKSTLDMST